jgi:hypothetical protein
VFDVFAAHRVHSFLTKLERAGIKVKFIPGGCQLYDDNLLSFPDKEVGVVRDRRSLYKITVLLFVSYLLIRCHNIVADLVCFSNDYQIILID